MVEVQDFTTGHRIAPKWLTLLHSMYATESILNLVGCWHSLAYNTRHTHFGSQTTGSSDCVRIWMEMYLVDHLVYRLDFCSRGSSTCKSSSLYNLHPVQEGVHLQEFHYAHFTPRPQQSHKEQHAPLSAYCCLQYHNRSPDTTPMDKF